MRLGSTLRLFGMRAVVDTEARRDREARAWWRALGAENLIQCRGASSVAWTAPRGRTRSLPPEQVAARPARAAAGKFPTGRPPASLFPALWPSSSPPAPSSPAPPHLPARRL